MRRIVVAGAVIAFLAVAAAAFTGRDRQDVRVTARSPTTLTTLYRDWPSWPTIPSPEPVVTATTLVSTATTAATVATVPTTPPPPATTLATTTTVFGTVAAVDGPGLYLIDFDGSDLRRIVSGARVGYLAWSPDGRRVAFTKGSTLAVTTLGGHVTVLDTNANVSRNGPSWHPSGATIAYVASGDGGRDVWIAAADGTTAPRRIPQPTDDAAVAYGPDGRIATMGYDGLFVSDDRGGNRQKLGDPNYNYGQVSWSPDGSRLMALPDSMDRHHIVDIATGAATRIGGTEPHSILSGAWSPTGTHLVFEGYYPEKQVFGTWLADADGSPATLVAEDVGDPRWASPQQIVAVQQGGREGGPWRLVVLGPGGSDRRTLLTYGTGQFRWMGQPHASPDGRTVAFVVNEQSRHFTP